MSGFDTEESEDDALSASRARYVAALAAGMPLRAIAVASIGFVQTDEGKAAERAWFRQFSAARAARGPAVPR